MSKQNQKIINKIDKVERDEMQRDIRTIRSNHKLSKVCADYLDQLVDCSTRKPVGAPTLIGGSPGRTGAIRLKQELQIAIGLGGFGYLAMCYQNVLQDSPFSGPFQDAPVFQYTSSDYQTTTVIQRGSPNPIGVTTTGWETSRYRFGDYGSSLGQTKILFRCVAAIAECTNVTEVLDQNGTITLYEPPSHVEVNSNASLDLKSVASERTSRVITAQNRGPRGDKVALNWHPGSSQFRGNANNDFYFNTSTKAPSFAPNSSPGIRDGLMVFQGKPGEIFHVTVSAVYEMKGRLVGSKKPRLTDSQGMNIIFNVLAAKALDGYVGNPRRVADGYLAKAWEVGKKLAGWVKEHEKAIMTGTGRALKMIAGID